MPVVIFNFILAVFLSNSWTGTDDIIGSTKRVKVLYPLQLEIGVLLEGPLRNDGQMHTNLHQRGYLPGQKPKTFFGQATSPGQPYNKAPWHYGGKEGVAPQKDQFDYPPTTVDWVLVTVLSNNESMQAVCRISGLLQSDGTITFGKDMGRCLVDIDASYFVVVEHRNHLSVISHLPLVVKNGRIKFDFRSLGDYDARLCGLKIDAAGRRVMTAGNGDQASNFTTSYTIDEEDLKMWRSENGMNSRYLTMDLDLSGDVSVKDQELLFNNYGTTSTVAFPK